MPNRPPNNTLWQSSSNPSDTWEIKNDTIFYHNSRNDTIVDQGPDNDALMTSIEAGTILPANGTEWVWTLTGTQSSWFQVDNGKLYSHDAGYPRRESIPLREFSEYIIRGSHVMRPNHNNDANEHKLLLDYIKSLPAYKRSSLLHQINTTCES